MDHHVAPMPDLNQPPHHLHTGKPGRKRPGKKPLVIIGVVLVVATLTAAGVLFFLKQRGDKATTAEQNQTTQQTEETSEPTLPPAEAAQLQTHKSETLKVEIAHRKDWTVAEDAEKKLLTLTSPKVALNNGSDRKDPFTLKIGFGASPDAQRNIGNATAVRDSLLVGYDAPTENQRHYTNVSYAGPPGEETTFFEFFIVTGSVAFKAGDPFGKSIIINSGDFLIRGGFGADVQNQLTYEQVPTAELEQYPVYEQALAIVKSLKVY
ncbi:MAG: hypothetical protein ACREGD_02005 [Candidatus Saccharimonadales bacterium]